MSKPGSDTPAANGAAAGDNFAEIERFVQGEMAAQRIPGLALGIVEGDRVVYVRGFGTADGSGREVTPKTPFVIGSVSKSVTALAVMQLVEANKIELDAPVQRYLPWFRVADEKASAQITVRHLLNHTSGLSTKTGRSFQGDDDTSDAALERAVRKLKSAELTAPVGSKHQYSTVNYSVLGLIVQTVAGLSYERYVQTRIFDPLEMRGSYTSEVAAEPRGLATGHNYWFGRPRAADLAYNRGLLPAGYLISSAEDMTHYLVSQLNGGRYRGTSLLSADGIGELHRPAVQTPEIVYAALFALLVLQARGIAVSGGELRSGNIRRGRIGPWWRIGLSVLLSLVWALVVLVLVPKQLGLPLSVVASGFPDLVYLLVASAVVAVAWAVVKSVWTYKLLRRLPAGESAPISVAS